MRNLDITPFKELKRLKKFFIIIFFISILIISCSKPTEAQLKKGKIPIGFSLKPAYDNGYQVTRVEAIITKEEFYKSMNLTIEADSAKGTFYDLESGTYHIKVNVYENENIIATGETDAEVKAGETTIVHITLHILNGTGNLEVIIDWIIEKNFPDSLLFIGNSYTYINGGLDVHLKRFAETANPDWMINTSRVAYGGFTLEQHYNNPTTIATINYGNHDYVILQEQNTRLIQEPDSMYYYAELLDQVIRDAGAKTLFFMTWANQDNPSSIDDIANAYQHIAKELNTMAIPVGRAFEKSLQIAPYINLYQSDQSHPNINGTFLVVYTFYAFLYDKNPSGVAYPDTTEISQSYRETLESIAWKTYLDYNSD